MAWYGILWHVYLRARWLVVALVFRSVAISAFTSSFSKFPLARSGQWVAGNSRTWPRVVWEFPGTDGRLLRLFLYRMDPGDFHQSCIFDFMRLGGLRDYPDNFCILLARIPCGRRRPSNQIPNTVSFRCVNFGVFVVWQCPLVYVYRFLCRVAYRVSDIIIIVRRGCLRCALMVTP